MSVGRDLDVTVNTGFLRVSGAHRNVLRTWLDLLSSPGYQEAQTRDVMKRPLHLLGTRKCCTALLGSESCVDEEVHLLRRGLGHRPVLRA